jgi:hypothetical protein
MVGLLMFSPLWMLRDYKTARDRLYGPVLKSVVWCTCKSARHRQKVLRFLSSSCAVLSCTLQIPTNADGRVYFFSPVSCTMRFTGLDQTLVGGRTPLPIFPLVVPFGGIGVGLANRTGSGVTVPFVLSMLLRTLQDYTKLPCSCLFRCASCRIADPGGEGVDVPWYINTHCKRGEERIVPVLLAPVFRHFAGLQKVALLMCIWL